MTFFAPCPLLVLVISPLPPVLEEALYDPLVEPLKLEEGSLFWRGSLVPLPSLPGIPNPFWVLPGGSRASSNPFESWCRSLPLIIMGD